MCCIVQSLLQHPCWQETKVRTKMASWQRQKQNLISLEYHNLWPPLFHLERSHFLLTHEASFLTRQANQYVHLPKSEIRFLKTLLHFLFEQSRGLDCRAMLHQPPVHLTVTLSSHTVKTEFHQLWEHINNTAMKHLKHSRCDRSKMHAFFFFFRKVSQTVKCTQWV